MDNNILTQIGFVVLVGLACKNAILIVEFAADRAIIREEWIERAMTNPIREQVQADGRIRRWTQVMEMEGRFLRVILLADGETIHNAFFDRGFKP